MNRAPVVQGFSPAKASANTLTAWLLAAVLAGGAGMLSPAAQAPVDVGKLGPQVGQTAPAFSGVDQSGRTQTLTSIMGEQGAMLVFYRSADW
jgi:hypothetical protein